MAAPQNQTSTVWKVYHLHLCPTRAGKTAAYQCHMRDDCSFMQLHESILQYYGWPDEELWCFSNEAGASGTASHTDLSTQTAVTQLLARQRDDLLYHYGLPEPKELWIRTERIYLLRDAPLLRKE